MISKVFEKLQDQAYRSAFVASQINIGIPFQIRALLKSRPDWTQATLADRSGMLQPRISALMTPGRVRPNIETLRRIAEAFDVGLIVRFAPFSELVKWSDEFDPENFRVPSFSGDSGFVERIPQGTAALFPREQRSLEDRQRNPENLIVMTKREAQTAISQPRASGFGYGG
jgi:transcriptional regulator with XRE-family HTH domain